MIIPCKYLYTFISKILYSKDLYCKYVYCQKYQYKVSNHEIEILYSFVYYSNNIWDNAAYSFYTLYYPLKKTN